MPPPQFSAVIRYLFVTLALLAFTLPSHAAGTCPAASFVISAGKTYDQAARARSASALANGVDRYSDMRAMAFFALGRYRGLLPKGREAEYVGLTKSFMGRFMLQHGGDLRIGTLKIVECTGSGGNITVTARTSNGKAVAFRIAKSGSGFAVRDIRAGSVWLVQLMRSNFVDIIRRNQGDIGALLKYLKR